jgi:hypothetical protein
MAAGAALIAASSLAYFDFDAVPPFVIEKLPVRFEALWLASLRIHVAAAIVSLPLCLALATEHLRRRPVWHRVIGRIAGVIVLFALVPSGVVLAFDAKGGPIVTAGFLLSAAIVAWGIVRGVMAARRRDFATHRRAMRHVVGQMSVAVTSRALLFALDAAGVDPAFAYVAALWGPVLASALVAELISGVPLKSLRYVVVSAIIVSLIPSSAQAGEPSLAESTQHRIEERLLKPLADFEKEGSRFSRARLPPRERRVRVLGSATSADAKGRAFLRFAIDVRFGNEWQENDIIGCAYPKSGELFVKRGDVYRPAAFLLGKSGEPAPGVCEIPRA